MEACLHIVEQAMGADVNPALLWNVHNPWSVAGSMLPAWDFLGICEDPAVADLVRPAVGDNILLVETDVVLPEGGLPATGSDLPLEPCAGAELRLHVDVARRTVTATVHSFDDPPAAIRSGVAVLAIRYAPATARFIRDPEHPANRARLSTRPLANPASGPIFLVSGENRADNNLARGFDRPRWQGTLELATETGGVRPLIVTRSVTPTGKWAGEAHHSAWAFLESASASDGPERLRLPQVGEALQAFVNGSAGFLESLGVYTVGFGFGLNDERQHSPNEFFRLSSFERGQRGYCMLLERLAE